jgi:hypothetical protein
MQNDARGIDDRAKQRLHRMPQPVGDTPGNGRQVDSVQRVAARFQKSAHFLELFTDRLEHLFTSVLSVQGRECIEDFIDGRQLSKGLIVHHGLV